MPSPTVAAYIIGIAIVAALYYMFSSSSEDEQQQQQQQRTEHGRGFQNSNRSRRRVSDDYDSSYRSSMGWTINSDNDCYNRECSICLNTLSDDKQITLQPCRHTFHAKCIREWETFEKSCPNCRQRFA